MVEAGVAGDLYGRVGAGDALLASDAVSKALDRSRRGDLDPCDQAGEALLHVALSRSSCS